jgi:putative Holliday junction resolvase
MHPVLAIDHGDARIGLAATDDLGIAAHAVGTIEVRKSDVFAELARITKERGTKKIVLGLPLRMDGSEGTSAEKVRAFGDLLIQALPEIPLTYFDERLTTVSASEKLREAGKNAKKQKALIDQTAALEILNGWLGW